MAGTGDQASGVAPATSYQVLTPFTVLYGMSPTR